MRFVSWTVVCVEDNKGWNTEDKYRQKAKVKPGGRTCASIHASATLGELVMAVVVVEAPGTWRIHRSQNKYGTGILIITRVTWRCGEYGRKGVG